MSKEREEYFEPEINQRVNFYGKAHLPATLVDKHKNTGLFKFDDGRGTTYSLPIPVKWKREIENEQLTMF